MNNVGQNKFMDQDEPLAKNIASLILSRCHYCLKKNISDFCGDLSFVKNDTLNLVVL